jgi:hypothetical protein
MRACTTHIHPHAQNLDSSEFKQLTLVGTVFFSLVIMKSDVISESCHTFYSANTSETRPLEGTQHGQQMEGTSAAVYECPCDRLLRKMSLYDNPIALGSIVVLFLFVVGYCLGLAIRIVVDSYHSSSTTMFMYQQGPCDLITCDKVFACTANSSGFCRNVWIHFATDPVDLVYPSVLVGKECPTLLPHLQSCFWDPQARATSVRLGSAPNDDAKETPSTLIILVVVMILIITAFTTCCFLQSFLRYKRRRALHLLQIQRGDARDNLNASLAAV